MGNALHVAAKNGDEKKYEGTFSENPKINKEGKTLKSGNTPLHKAAQYGHTAIAADLISRGVDVNVKNNDEYTALHLACRNGHTDTVKELLILGADQNSRGGVWGSTPLHWACIGGHSEVIKILIEKAADVDVKDGTGNVPFNFIRDAALKDEIMGGGLHVETEEEQEEAAKAERARLREEAKQRKAQREREEAERAKSSAESEMAIPAAEQAYKEEEDEEDDGEEIFESVPPAEQVSLNRSSPSKTNPSAYSERKFRLGAKIEGKHEGGPIWYPGIISAVNRDGTYNIDYDDGDKESNVQPMYIRELDYEDEDSLSDEDAVVRTVNR